MKHVKLLSFAFVALAALTAFAGSASATTLTSPKGTVYTASGKGEAEGGGIYLTSAFGGFGAVTCKKAGYGGKVEFHGAGITAGGKLSLLTFEECSGATITSPVAKPGSLEVHGTTAANNATVTATGGEFILHQTAVGTCIFLTNNTDIGQLTGSNITGGNATVHVSANLEVSSKTPWCGSVAKLEGSIRITSPVTLEVD